MKRAIFFFLLAFLGLTATYSQGMKWTKSYQDYFDQYQDAAIEQMQRHGIPASITLAQGVLETGAGSSELARKANNHFGIKCNGWTGRKAYHDDDATQECFRAYDSVSQSYEDHSLFLVNSKRYASLFQLKPTDYKGWAKGLKACGYATSPTYATKLIEIIELYNLHQFDDPSGIVRTKPQQNLPPTTVQPVAAPAMRKVFFFNNNYYVLAHKGETYQSLADEVGVSYKKLAKYNEKDKYSVLSEGEIVWLEKKQKCAPKEYLGFEHVVAPGESVYSIAQKYGIRLKNIYKINNLPPDCPIRVGDRLALR